MGKEYTDAQFMISSLTDNYQHADILIEHMYSLFTHKHKNPDLGKLHLDLNKTTQIWILGRLHLDLNKKL